MPDHVKPRSSHWTNGGPSGETPALRAANNSFPQARQKHDADRTTLAVREITERAAKDATAQVARLRAARLAKEAADKAENVPAMKPKRKS